MQAVLGPPYSIEIWGGYAEHRRLGVHIRLVYGSAISLPGVNAGVNAGVNKAPPQISIEYGWPLAPTYKTGF